MQCSTTTALDLAECQLRTIVSDTLVSARQANTQTKKYSEAIIHLIINQPVNHRNTLSTQRGLKYQSVPRIKLLSIKLN